MSTLPDLRTKDDYKPRRPTASQIIEEENIKDWSDKVIILTGATSGIGIETAKTFAKIGAHLILPVRDQQKAQNVIEDIKKIAGNKTHITLLPLDLTSLQSVREFVAQFLKLNIPLNILICNAAVMSTPKEMKTKDGFDMQFGVNHLSTFLLFELLKEKLIASSTKDFNSRFIIVSSMAHHLGNIDFDDLQNEKAYEPMQAYGKSKTATILTMREIERRYGSQGIHALAVHPGSIATNLQQYISPETMQKLMTSYALPPGFHKTPEEGAATTVWAACSKEFEGKGGEYLEDCSYSYVEPPENTKALTGIRAYAYDAENAKRLYDLSFTLCGF